MSLDIRLQKLVETWYGNRRGALVAIEPQTGDVLAFVSMPNFDPNLFVDGIDQQSWQELNTNPDRPLLNRPLRGTYPPGSTYKPFMALAVSKSGVRKPKESIFDPGYFALGKHRFRDSKPAGHGNVDLYRSIVVSSDTYYYGAAYAMGVDYIHDFMKPWGFGQLTGIDLRDEATGVLPSTDWKKRRFKQPWYPGETPSIGIGQGYNSFTILQLAHATATLANDAVVMRPHVVKSVEDATTGVHAPERRQGGRAASTSRPRRCSLVKNAMVAVNKEGTGSAPFTGAEYVAAGKTGTAQVIGIKQNEKYDARKIAERHRDHSLFVAFAPADKPKIAVALIVENGGFGAQSAAPIARRVFDYYLLGKLPKDQDLPFPDRIDEEEMRDVPESIEPELAPARSARCRSRRRPPSASPTGRGLPPGRRRPSGPPRRGATERWHGCREPTREQPLLRLLVPPARLRVRPDPAARADADRGHQQRDHVLGHLRIAGPADGPYAQPGAFVHRRLGRRQPVADGDDAQRDSALPGRTGAAGSGRPVRGRFQRSAALAATSASPASSRRNC